MEVTTDAAKINQKALGLASQIEKLKKERIKGSEITTEEMYAFREQLVTAETLLKEINNDILRCITFELLDKDDLKNICEKCRRLAEEIKPLQIELALRFKNRAEVDHGESGETGQQTDHDETRGRRCLSKGEAEDMKKEVKQRTAAMRGIQRSIYLIESMFASLSISTAEQTHVLNNIERNIEETAQNTMNARAHIQQRYCRERRRVLWNIAFLLLVALLVLSVVLFLISAILS